MSNYYSKGVVNKYWKRPKPRVYECNVRDAERFYQQSYKDYLEAKEYAARKASEPTIRYGEDSTSRWGTNRSNSLIDSEGSGYQALNGHRSSYLDSLSSSKQYGDNSYTGGSSYRSSSVTNQRNKSPDADFGSIEQKLQRLQKLRSELGVPSESGRDSNYASSSTTTTSRLRTARQTSPPSDIRDRIGRSSDRTAGSYSTLQSRSRAVADYSSDNYGDKTSGAEKSVRFSKYSTDEDSYTRPDRTNGRASSYSKDEPDKYSFKSSARTRDRKFDTTDDDTYSFSPSESKSTKSYKSSISRKAADTTKDDDIGDYDDDALLSNIKKKFPTSDEILERIKKMDSDM